MNLPMIAGCLRRPASWKAACWVCACAMGPLVTGGALADDGPALAGSLGPQSAALVADDVAEWLGLAGLAETERNAARAGWKELPAEARGAEVVEAIARIACRLDPELGARWEGLDNPQAPTSSAEGWQPDTAWPPAIAAQVRLAWGVRLAVARHYDEAARQLAELDPQAVLDPASLLFFRAVAAQQLLDRERGLRDAERLLAEVAGAPARYRALAELIRDDLRGLSDDSLARIARQMRDIERRLGFGQADPRVREIEADVLAALDKLIDELEQEQDQQSSAAAAAAAAAGQPLPSRPADQSQALGGKGAGKTDRRNLEDRGGWGDLPPKLRGEALQQLGRDFPAHYRDVVEQYFRRLASGDAETSDAPEPELPQEPAP